MKEEKIKVLLITGTLDIAGAETFLMNLVRSIFCFSLHKKRATLVKPEPSAATSTQSDRGQRVFSAI